MKKTFVKAIVLLSLISFLPSSALIHKLPEGRYNDKGHYLLVPYDQITFIKTNSEGEEKTYSGIPVLPNGYITLPGYGEVKIGDKSVEEFKNSLPLEEGEKVDIILTYHQRSHVIVIGEVDDPGSYSVKDMVSIYDAIGTAGGFSKQANKRKVKVIRQKLDGTRDTFHIDFPKEVFNAYEEGIGEDRYLVKENDIVYVPPSRLKQTVYFLAEIAKFATFGILTGVLSAAVD